MPRPVIRLRELLAAVKDKCTVREIWEGLGAACHRCTVWRVLGRAQALDLVTSTPAIGVSVWELTPVGERTLDGDGDRPRCRKCSKSAGSRLELDADEVYRFVAGTRVRCRLCGHHWLPNSLEREAAEAADRLMSSERDEFALALTRHQGRQR